MGEAKSGKISMLIAGMKAGFKIQADLMRNPIAEKETETAQSVAY